MESNDFQGQQISNIKRLIFGAANVKTVSEFSELILKQLDFFWGQLSTIRNYDNVISE